MECVMINSGSSADSQNQEKILDRLNHDEQTWALSTGVRGTWASVYQSFVVSLIAAC